MKKPAGIISYSVLTGIFGSGPKDVWTGGNYGWVINYDGSKWTKVTTPAALTSFKDVWSSGPGAVWFLGTDHGSIRVLRHDGAKFTQHNSISGTYLGFSTYGAVWGTGPTDLYVAGGVIANSTGVLRRSDGTSPWKLQAIPPSGRLYDIWGSSSTDVHAVGQAGAVLTFDGKTWKRAGRRFESAEVHDLWADSPSNIYLASKPGEVLRFDGKAWTTLASGTSKPLRGITGTAAGEVYAVGDGGTVQCHDGKSWFKSVNTGSTNDLKAAWSDSKGQVIAVGNLGQVLRCSACKCSVDKSGVTSALRAVWGSGPKDVYAVGDSGTVIHHDGSGWKTVSGIPKVSASTDLHAAWVSPTGDLWAAGASGTLLHRSKTGTWTTHAPGIAGTLSTVWGSASGKVYVGGPAGALSRYDGKTWTLQKTGTARDLLSVRGIGAGQTLLLAKGGALLRGCGK